MDNPLVDYARNDVEVRSKDGSKDGRYGVVLGIQQVSETLDPGL